MAGNSFEFGKLSNPVQKFDNKVYDISSHVARQSKAPSLRKTVHPEYTAEQKNQVIMLSKNDAKKSMDMFADTLTNKYNEQTRLLIERESSKNSSIRLKNNQSKEINRNTGKLNRLKNDILTIRRQVEHNESNYKLKSNRLIILKNFLYAFTLIIIVVILKKNFGLQGDRVDSKLPEVVSNFGVYNIIMVVIGIYFGSKILLNLYINRNTNSIVFTKYDWNNPTDDEKKAAGVIMKKPLHTGAKAITCSTGSHIDPYDPALCVLNKCTCSYGTENTGTKCVVHGQESCDSCIGGYQLLNGKCKSKEPQCQTQAGSAT